MTPLNDHWRDCGLEPRATLAFSRFRFSRTYGCLKPLWASTAGSRLHRHCDDSRPWCQRHREEEAALPYSKRAWSRRQESNLQPEIYKNSVLPVELRRQIRRPDWMGETSARRPPSVSITWERCAYLLTGRCGMEAHRRSAAPINSDCSPLRVRLHGCTHLGRRRPQDERKIVQFAHGIDGVFDAVVPTHPIIDEIPHCSHLLPRQILLLAARPLHPRSTCPSFRAATFFFHRRLNEDHGEGRYPFPTRLLLPWAGGNGWI